MSDYTPTTEAIRGRIIQRGIGWGFYGLDEFDRWLATHDAAKRAEWEAEQGETGKLRAVEKFVADAEEAGVILDLAERFATSTDRAAGVVDRAWRDGLRRILGPVPDTTNNESEDE